MRIPGSENDVPWQYTRVQTSKLSNQNVALTSNQLYLKKSVIFIWWVQRSAWTSQQDHSQQRNACLHMWIAWKKKKKKQTSNRRLTDTQSNEREKGQRRLGWLRYCILNYSFVVAQAIGTEHGDDDSYYTWGSRHRNCGSCFTRELQRSYCTRIRNTDVPRL